MSSRYFLIQYYRPGRALECDVEETSDSAVVDIEDDGMVKYRYNVDAPPDEELLVKIVLAKFGSTQNELSIPLYSDEIKWTWWGIEYSVEGVDEFEFVLEAEEPRAPVKIEVGKPGVYRVPDSCDSEAIFRNSLGELLSIDVSPFDDGIYMVRTGFQKPMEKFKISREELVWCRGYFSDFIDGYWTHRCSARY